jgi:hypothetical protein
MHASPLQGFSYEIISWLPIKFQLTEEALCNPRNPVNPDSKPRVAGKFILKPIGEKTRGIASLQKNGIKSNHLQMTLMLKPKMSFLILKILIQNQLHTNTILNQ